MRLAAAALVCLLLGCGCATICSESGDRGDLHQADSQDGHPVPELERQLTVSIGQRALDEDLWAPTDRQLAFGLEFSYEGTWDPIGWEVGIAGSEDTSDLGGNGFTGNALEFYGGIHKSLGSGRLRPYVGAGLSLIRAEFKGLGQSEDDASPALYVHGGVQYLFSPAFGLGLDLRALFGSDITLYGVPGDADYTQAALTFGWHF